MTHSFATTYLGIEKKEQSAFNGVLFEIDESQLDLIDSREFLYERIELSPKSVEILVSDFELKKEQQIWIYLTKDPKKVTAEFPLIQSYIDVCLKGCLEVEDRFSLHGFAEEFLKTTYGWSKFWVNDRIFPRAPHIYESRAFEIDKLLYTHLYEYYKEITIE